MFHILCTHFDECSGCQYKATLPPPEIYERAKTFFHTIGSPLELIQGDARHWRARAKLAVRKNGKDLLIGLYKEGTHDVVAIPFCRVHHPSINEAIERFKQAFSHTCLTVYNEHTGQGDLRYLQCIVERRTKKVSLGLVVNFSKNNAEKIKVWTEFFRQLQDNGKNTFWHSFWLNCNEAKTNAIFSQEWLHVLGSECLWEKICGIEIPYGPSHFGQANLELFERVIEDIHVHVPLQSNVIEFYAGMGVIGLTLAEKCASVIISEREKSAEHYFLQAKERLAYPVQKKVHFLTGAAEKQAELIEEADICVVDPPRKGLDQAFLQTLCQSSNVKEIIYVSCNFDSFARDCTQILSTSGMKLVSAKSYLFFPGTNHIEILAVFAR